MKHYSYIETPMGCMTVCEEDQLLTKLLWGKIPMEGIYKETALLRLTAKEINAYFQKKLTKFSVPYSLCGSEFQKDVWKTLALVPYGTTISYQELALKCGHPKACRAVGTACKNNPINLIIPCHRIINKNGTAGNYRGGAERKRHLLILEKKEVTLFPHSVIYL